MGVLFCHLGHALGVGLWGSGGGGGGGGVKFFFSNMVMWHIRDDEQNIMQVNFSS